MQSTSRALCQNIPEIVCKAIKANLREFPRYEVILSARLEFGDEAVNVAFHDISQSGARNATLEALGFGDQAAIIPASASRPHGGGRRSCAT